MISNERIEHLKGCVENLAKSIKWESVQDAQKMLEVSEALSELLALRKAFSVPALWEVKGLYCHTYDEAKSLYPDREPDPLFYKPD